MSRSTRRPPPVGGMLVLTAGVAHKKKSKPGVAKILSETARGGGEDVVVAPTLPPCRTTEISLPAAAAGP